MKYILVDRFLELEPRKRALAVKCVTLGEPFLAGLDGYPAPLVLEGLLQTGGLLARVGDGFRRRSVLGTVHRAAFPGRARPGDRIAFAVDVELARDEGVLCRGTARVGDEVVGTAEFMIVFVPEDRAPPPDAALERKRDDLLKAWGVPPELTPAGTPREDS